MATELLPRPERTTWRSQAAASQRDRLLTAMAEACVDVGYSHTRVADVIARAGVSRRTFYEHFANLEDCVLATYDRGVEVLTSLLGATIAELPPGSDWTTILDALLTTYLGALAAEPTFTQFALVEVLAAGATARQRYLEVVDRFHALLRQVDGLARAQRPDSAPVSDLELMMFAGGLNRLVMTEVMSGRGHDLLDRLGELRALGVKVLDAA
jgi:AcrR family transcriptional regulator